MKERRLTRLEREKIVRDFGATKEEIAKATKRANVIRNRRKRCVALQDQDDTMEAIDDVKNLIKSFKKKLGIIRRRTSLEQEVVDMERLHPTLIAMMGFDEEE